MKFRPAFWPTAMAFPAFLVLLALGTWQVQRLAWKTALNEHRATAAHGAPVPLPRTLEEAKTNEFRPVRVEGVFDHGGERYIGATSERGQLGFYIVTPLKLADGRVLLVNRGFVPSELKDPARRKAGEVEGEVAVEGLIRVPPDGKPSWIAPENHPESNMWFWMAPAAMAPGSLPFYVDAGPAPNPGGWPKGGVTRLALPNDHLQYAITWYALAVALAVIYVVYHRQNPLAPKP
jgi:surfeit locus 1 family protein